MSDLEENCQAQRLMPYLRVLSLKRCGDLYAKRLVKKWQVVICVSVMRYMQTCSIILIVYHLQTLIDS